MHLSTRMSEPGESLDSVRMPNVAAWLLASRGRVQPGPESQNLRPPNMPLQRTGGALAAERTIVRQRTGP